MINTQLFTHAINPQHDMEQLKQEILNRDPSFYTFDFKELINTQADDKITIDEFWKLAKVKAKKVSLFVPEILSCNVIEDSPLGFIREISMPGNDVTQSSDKNIIHIKERVIVDDKTKTLLFFQLNTDGKILLFAINQAIEENQKLYFTGHYVYSVRKDSQNQEDVDFIKQSNATLPSRINAMIGKMMQLYKDGQLDHIYNSLYQ